MNFYPITILGKNENSVNVKPGEVKDIIRIKVPKGYLLFVYSIEIDKWYPNARYEVWMDGELVYSYNREGRFNYDPPYVVKKELRIVGVNYSSEELPMGAFVDGVVMRR